MPYTYISSSHLKHVTNKCPKIMMVLVACQRFDRVKLTGVLSRTSQTAFVVTEEFRDFVKRSADFVP